MVFRFIKGTFLSNVDKFVIRWFEKAGANKQPNRIFSFLLDFDQLNEIELKLINLDLHATESHYISIWLSKDPFAVIRKLLSFFSSFYMLEKCFLFPLIKCLRCRNWEGGAGGKTPIQILTLSQPVGVGGRLCPTRYYLPTPPSNFRPFYNPAM